MRKTFSIDTVEDITTLDYHKMKYLRVKNTTDKFTIMHRVYQLAQHLNLTSIETLSLVKLYKDEYHTNNHKLKIVFKTFKSYLMFVLRWQCRGLSTNQSIQKAIIDNELRIEWFNNQQKFWKKHIQ